MAIDTTLVSNWDNKLRHAQYGPNSIDLKYDPAGNRIYKETSNGSTKRKYIVDIVGDLPVILMEIDATDFTVKKAYIYGNSQIIAQYDGDWRTPLDCKNFYLHDRLGSVRQIINCGADAVKMYTYEPFGETIEQDGSFANPFKFSGQFFDDEIDQYYLRARQYEPYISRFTNRDAADGKFDNPLSLHKYLYCQNEPINRIDIIGLRYIPAGGPNYDWKTTKDVIERATKLVGKYKNTRDWWRGPWEAFGTEGEYDYKGSGYTFKISEGGKSIQDSEFGNYLAGYTTYHNWGIRGELGARAVGHWYARGDWFLAPFEGRLPETLYPIDDYGSRYWITRGVLDANLKQREVGRGIGGQLDEIRIRTQLTYYFCEMIMNGWI
jgi:RHS repeat-associated protein